MEKVKLECSACGFINERKQKPEPTNAREGKQIYFICSNCRIKNLRDGSFDGQDPNEIIEEQEAIEYEPESLEEDYDEYEEEDEIEDEEEQEAAKKEEQSSNVFVTIGLMLLGFVVALLGGKGVSNNTNQASNQTSPWDPVKR